MVNSKSILQILTKSCSIILFDCFRYSNKPNIPWFQNLFKFVHLVLWRQVFFPSICTNDELRLYGNGKTYLLQKLDIVNDVASAAGKATPSVTFVTGEIKSKQIHFYLVHMQFLRRFKKFQPIKRHYWLRSHLEFPKKWKIT